MAESSKDIQSGCKPLKSPLCGEKETSLDKKFRNAAFILALIEKAASTLGTMNFIWATAVLLGGFSQSLKTIDFWYVSLILVVEGLRIICRHGELATRRSWPPHSTLISIICLYSLVIQELSAFACIALSQSRIEKQQYGSDGNLNRNRALNLFYWLSMVESTLTVLGFIVRGYLHYSAIRPPNEKTSYCKRTIQSLFDVYRKILLSIAVGKGWRSALKEDGFDDSQLYTVLRFFWDTYCRCMNESVFDGLKMDFVSYSVKQLQSIEYDDQLAGALLLSALVKSDRLPSEKLRVIGTTPGVLNMLIEMLNWEKPREQEIREAAGEIIYKLVKIPRNRVRVMKISESRESIASLLYDRNKIGIHSTWYQGQFPDKNIYKYSHFTVLGLRILQILANDPDNCAKIGKTPGVLNMLIEMLNWEKPQEQEIRRKAGEIIYKLVEKPRNRIRVMVLPEVMESITSFLYDRNKIEIHSTKYQGQFPDKNIYKYSDFTVLGLQILKILANDPDNCAKIGTSKGLLCKIIELNPEASESEILGHLKITPIETLASLARKEGVRENIEGTSGFEAEHSDDPNLQSFSIQVN